jgi:cell division protein FtsB
MSTIAPMETNTVAAQASLAAALRQVLNQLLRLLEQAEPNGADLTAAVEGWRRAIVAHTSSLPVQRARELEDRQLEAQARASRLEKECADLRARNAELLDEIVRLNKREEGLRQELLNVQFARDGHRAEAKRLDLEIRDLRRQIRELEGGPPLTPSEAAPRSTTDVGEQPPEEAPVQQPVMDARGAAEAAFRAMWRPPESAKTGTPAAKKTAKKPAAPKKPAAARKTAPKKTPAAKKTPAKKTAAEKTPGRAKKAAAQKATADKKKPAGKKPAKKKTAKKKT